MQLLSSSRPPMYGSEFQGDQSKQSYLQNQNAPPPIFITIATEGELDLWEEEIGS